MKLSKKIIFLLRNAWMTAKGFVLISAITNIFQAILSFGNIIGTGLIVEALLSKKSLDQVFLLILIFSCANFERASIAYFRIYATPNYKQNAIHVRRGFCESKLPFRARRNDP